MTSSNKKIVSFHFLVFCPGILHNGSGCFTVSEATLHQKRVALTVIGQTTGIYNEDANYLMLQSSAAHKIVTGSGSR